YEYELDSTRGRKRV
ncbi:hypothetical protein HaLaN_30116, partial [Haematococcus lacustris]